MTVQMTCGKGYTESDEQTERRYKSEDRKFKIFVFLVFPICLITTETTVYWNNLDGVYSIASVGQLVPLILGIGLIVYMTFCDTLLDEDIRKLDASRREQVELTGR